MVDQLIVCLVFPPKICFLFCFLHLFWEPPKPAENFRWLNSLFILGSVDRRFDRDSFYEQTRASLMGSFCLGSSQSHASYEAVFLKGSPSFFLVSLCQNMAATNSRCMDIGQLGPPVVPFYPFFGESSPAKIDYRKKLAPLSYPLYWKT